MSQKELSFLYKTSVVGRVGGGVKNLRSHVRPLEWNEIMLNREIPRIVEETRNFFLFWCSLHGP